MGFPCCLGRSGLGDYRRVLEGKQSLQQKGEVSASHPKKCSPGELGGTWASQPHQEPAKLILLWVRAWHRTTGEARSLRFCVCDSQYFSQQRTELRVALGAKMRECFRSLVAQPVQWVGVSKWSFLLPQNTRAPDIKMMKSILQLKL